jgi:hypothetical protein
VGGNPDISAAIDRDGVGKGRDQTRVVMDNLNIHRLKSLTDLLGEQVGGEVWGRFTVHYTPTHGGWLNQAKIEIGILSRQCLGTRRRAFRPSFPIMLHIEQVWQTLPVPDSPLGSYPT